MPESFDDWFDRELATVKAGLARLEASLAPQRQAAAKPQPRPRKRVKRRIKKVVAAIASSTTALTADASMDSATTRAVVSSHAEPPAVPTEQPSAVSVAPTQPTGRDLADPRNFGLMPLAADLERGTDREDEYRQRLSRHIAFATKVLHTSRVPAAVWREWRAFEKAAQERLRELTSRPVETGDAV